jgi:GT2 family glycosyltransferase
VVSVIVLNYNGRQWLTGCLDALAAQSGAPPFETILVDNASHDGSAAFVRSRYPGVRLVESPVNLGFAGGNNLGARHSTGELLVFLNNDTVASPDWLSRLSGALEARPSFGLATSRLVRMDDASVIDSAGDGYLHAGGAFKRGHGRPAADFEVSGEVFGACGAAFAIRRELFERLGGFDETFFMVYEDVDLSYRARLLGFRCWYAADAVVRHAGSATLGRASPAAVFFGQRNLEWTWLKNTPASMLWRTAPAHMLYAAAGLFHYARSGCFGAAARGKFAALRGLPSILRSRRAVQAAATSPECASALFDRDWLAIKRAEKRQAGISDH